MIPYQDLYILEISGEVLGSRSFFREDFSGCWNKGEISFLFFSTPHDGESGRIEVRQGNAEDLIKEEVELLCANLHSQVIEALLKKEAFFRKRWLILSGLFIKDGEEIAGRLNRGPLQIFQKIQDRKWMTLVGLNGVENP